MFASTEQNKEEKNRFPRRASTDRNNNFRYLLFLLCHPSVPHRFYWSLLVWIYVRKCPRLTVLCHQYISGFQSGTPQNGLLCCTRHWKLLEFHEFWREKWRKLSRWCLGSLEDEEFSEEGILKEARWLERVCNYCMQWLKSKLRKYPMSDVRVKSGTTSFLWPIHGAIRTSILLHRRKIEERIPHFR